MLITEDENEAIEQQEAAQQIAYKKLKTRTIWAGILSIPVVILGMFFMDKPYVNEISFVLSAPVIFWIGRQFFIQASKQARHLKANMDTLVALSTGIAFVFSAFNTFFGDFWHSRGLHPHVYYEAATVIVFFILLGKLLEERAKSQTSTALKKLMGLQPKTVTILEDDTEKIIPIDTVQKGQIILVKPGDQIPVDGKVVSGQSYVDESMLSGEPVAILKKAGEQVYAGTINQKGSFQFEAEKVGADTFLSSIIQMVKQAQGSKAPVQKLVDRIAGIFVPIVIGISIITFILWIILGGENGFTQGLMAMVTVLVIACPCALGLATPTAIMVGVGKGASNGILIKDAESLENAVKVDTVLLDKTGTITEGKPTVNQMINIAAQPKDLAVLLAMEKKSEHPLAHAVTSYLVEQDIKPTALDEFESHTGMGVSASLKGQTYFLGNEKLLLENQVSIAADIQNQVSKLAASGQTVICFAKQDSILALIAISDQIKSNTMAAIQELQSMDISVYMLTGDNSQTAQAVANEVGIDEVHASLLPQDKSDIVAELQAKGKVVAMVGDGINDSQALALADVSIAMGKGSDIAIDVAKMTITSSDLKLISKAIKLSKQTVRTIRQNLFWAFIYNLIGIPIAAGLLYPINGFLLNPMIAGAAMALSSVSVVTNSLRLKNSKL